MKKLATKPLIIASFLSGVFITALVFYVFQKPEVAHEKVNYSCGEVGLFQSLYQHNGQTKRISLWGHPLDNGSHANQLVLSGKIEQVTDNCISEETCNLELQANDFMRIGYGWDNSPDDISMVRIGDDEFAVAITTSDTTQGIYTSSIDIVAGVKGKLQPIFSGLLAFDHDLKNHENYQWAFVPGKLKKYYDLHVLKSEGEKSPKKTAYIVYKFDGDKYVQAKELPPETPFPKQG